MRRLPLPLDLRPAGLQATWHELPGRSPAEAAAESPAWGDGPRRLWRSGGRTW